MSAHDRPGIVATTLLIVAAISGCTEGSQASAKDAQQTPPSHQRHQDDNTTAGNMTPTDDAALPADTPGGPRNSTWELFDCRALRATWGAEYETVQQVVPDPYRPSRFVIAEAVAVNVRVVSCEALIIDNQTLVAPFSWYAILIDVDDVPPTFTHPQFDAYVLEMVVTNTTAATRLKQYGFPAAAGDIEWQPGTSPEILHVSTPERAILDLTTLAWEEPSASIDAASAGYHWVPEDGLPIRLDRVYQAESEESMVRPNVMRAHGGILGEWQDEGHAAPLPSAKVVNIVSSWSFTRMQVEP